MSKGTLFCLMGFIAADLMAMMMDTPQIPFGWHILSYVGIIFGGFLAGKMKLGEGR